MFTLAFTFTGEITAAKVLLHKEEELLPLHVEHTFVSVISPANVTTENTEKEKLSEAKNVLYKAKTKQKIIEDEEKLIIIYYPLSFLIVVISIFFCFKVLSVLFFCFMFLSIIVQFSLFPNSI